MTHIHSRQCYEDPGPAHGSPFLVCGESETPRKSSVPDIEFYRPTDLRAQWLLSMLAVTILLRVLEHCREAGDHAAWLLVMERTKQLEETRDWLFDVMHLSDPRTTEIQNLISSIKQDIGGAA